MTAQDGIEGLKVSLHFVKIGFESALFVCKFLTSCSCNRQPAQLPLRGRAATLPVGQGIFVLLTRLARYMGERFSQPQSAKSSSPVDIEEKWQPDDGISLKMQGIAG